MEARTPWRVETTRSETVARAPKLRTPERSCRPPWPHASRRTSTTCSRATVRYRLPEIGRRCVLSGRSCGPVSARDFRYPGLSSATLGLRRHQRAMATFAGRFCVLRERSVSLAPLLVNPGRCKPYCPSFVWLPRPGAWRRADRLPTSARGACCQEWAGAGGVLIERFFLSRVRCSC